ncbi:isopenicillin N synthase family dioxygenase [Rhodococcus sp. NPDC055112]
MLPVIDFGELTSARGRLALRRATHELGFFYLTGHGVPRALIDEALDVAHRFFALPVEEKMSIEMLGSPHFRGYTRLGGELTEGRTDWREQIDIGPERPAIPGAVGCWNLQGPNRWPKALPELRETIIRWDAELSRLGLELLREWAVSLGASADVFDPAFATDPATLIKVVRYPGHRFGEVADQESDQGVGAHKDSGVLTLLLVEPGSGGLQVEGRAGDWIDAPPLPGAFIVNIGELLEVATAGYLRATRHRVLSPPGSPERISVPYFFNPALDAVVPVLTLPAELAGRARGVSADPGNPIFDTYGANAWKSRVRAHPDVAARWGHTS